MAAPITNYTVDGWKEYLNDKWILDLSKRDLTDEHIVALAEVLKENTRITSINLSENKFTAIGAKALAQALIANKSIASHPLTCTGAIDVSGNHIGLDGFLALCSAIVKSGRPGYCFSVDETFAVNPDGTPSFSEKEAEELNNNPDLKELARRTEMVRGILYGE